MPRLFTAASSEFITTSSGALGTPTAFSFAFVVNRTDNATSQQLFRATTGGGTAVLSFSLNATGVPIVGNNAAVVTGVDATAAAVWLLVTVSKAAGTSTPDFGVYTFSSNTWASRAGSGTLADTSGTPTTIGIGRHQASGLYLNGSLAIGAIWGRVLSTSEFDQLPYSYQAWVNSAPTVGWLFDQSSTSQKLLDWTGGGANESAITGTAVSTLSVPILGYGHPVIQATQATPVASGTISAGLPALSATAGGYAGTPQTLFTSQTPTGADFSDGTPSIATATTVQFAQAGHATAVRWYATTTVSGTYTVAMWQVTSNDTTGHTGTLLISKTAAATPTAGTWNKVVFDIPVAVTTGTLYRVAVFSSAGRYVATASFFTTALTHGDITAPANGSNPVGLGTLGQGTFVLNASLAYPENTSGNASSYFVDVDFVAPSSGESGSVAASLPALTASASGTASATANAAVTLPALTSAASGTASTGATAAVTLPALSAAVSGVVGMAGTLAAGLPALSAAASGTASATGSAAVTLPALGAQASGTVTATATVTAGLPALTAAAAGVAGTAASAAVILPALSAAASGTASAQASTVATLPGVQAAVAGEVQGATSGGVAVTLPALGASASGAASTAGTVAGTLPSLTAQAAGTLAAAGTASAALPPLQASADAQATATGDIGGALPALQATAVGATGVVAVADAVLPALVAAAQGTASVTAVAAVDLPALAASISDAPVYTRRPGVLTAGTIRSRLVADVNRGPAYTTGG